MTPLKVVFGVAVVELPPDVRMELRLRLVRIATSMERIPENDVEFWDSVSLGGLQLDLGTWRIVYRVDRGSRPALIVDQVLFKRPPLALLGD